MTEKGTDRIHIRVPTDLKRKAHDKSKRTGISLTHVLRKALEQWVKEPDPA